jgi:hypothetical protein
VDQVVELGHQFRQIADIVRHAQTRAELLDQLDARRTVAVVARPERFRRQPFAEVVAQGGKAHVDSGDSIAAIVTVISVCRPVSISGCHLPGPARRTARQFPGTAP